jgi:Holliday junction resolvase-like predicted endonuclease
MARHNELGKAGETRAREFLEAKEYKIRSTNYRAGKL